MCAIDLVVIVNGGFIAPKPADEWNYFSISSHQRPFLKPVDGEPGAFEVFVRVRHMILSLSFILESGSNIITSLAQPASLHFLIRKSMASLLMRHETSSWSIRLNPGNIDM